MKNVIHIYGASGSGTTTLGKKICDELGYKLIDTDEYYWLQTDPPYKKKRKVVERVELMKKNIIESENVVISGEIAGWGDELITYFTLAIRLELDPTIRLERLKTREKERFGTRIENGGDMYEHHLQFMEWARQYDFAGEDIRSKTQHDKWEQKLRCKRIALDSMNDIENNFQKIQKMLIE